MKKVYILHQYLDENHFKTLYECGKKNGYNIADYFIADKAYIIKNVIKKEIFRKELGLTWNEALEFLFKQKRLKQLHDEILIVGLAPYDKLLFKYEKVIKNNNSIYFSSWQFWDGTNFPRGKYKNKAKWEEILSTAFNGAACVSRATYSGVSEFINYTYVVNHAIPVEEYYSKEDFTVKHRYLFIGRFEKIKNIQYIIKWIESNPDIEFTFDFAGFGSYKKNIEELQEKDSRVHYLGFLTKDELKSKIHTYDYTVLPSKIEPFGITLIESLAAGVPCLTSNATGPAEIIEDGYNGIICDKDDYNSYEEAMRKTLNLKKDEYMKLCYNAAISGVKYSNSSIIKIWCQIFDKIIGVSSEK